MGLENFSEGAKYEKKGILIYGKIFFIQNDKVLLNDTEHINKLIY